mgnify:FL=1|tara:strand:+ start:713 stop:3013 length:2301 start_codon:yes stop_codon:yes gene_type:complete
MEASQQTATMTFVPPDFYCPISGDLMNDPVIGTDGHSYERSEIMKWLSNNKTSPMTREALHENDLTDNLTLKRSIDSIRDKLNQDQLKIKSRIVDEKTKVFQEKLDEIRLEPYWTNNELFVEVQMPDVEIRPPVDLVLCIDVSGSMGAEATLKGGSNETISHGFSVLSLTISAAKTILHSLNEDDNLSVVTYSAVSEVIFANVSCTKDNKIMIESGLNTLKPTFNTNMWAGIIESLDILRKTSPPHRIKSVFLLTDGIPNVVPPRGHTYMLEKYFHEHQFKCPISFYGFGYHLESTLLRELADVSGSDGYSFIPDASLLGNVFIHGLSNLFITAAQYPTLQITLSNNVSFTDKCSMKTIHIDSLKYGKSKNFMFSLDTKQGSRIPRKSIQMTLQIGDKIIKSNPCVTPADSLWPQNFRLEKVSRLKAITIIDECVTSKEYRNFNASNLEKFIAELRIQAKDSEFIKNILLDFEGQVREALNLTLTGEKEDWFQRWGRHYLRSLAQAYRNEICNNFKDKGVSNFGGALFDKMRDEVDKVFGSLPPPKADIKQYPQMRGVAGAPRVNRAPRPVNMAAYNNQSGPCCAGQCHVLMADESYKQASEIKKGDEVMTYSTRQDSQGRYQEMFSKSEIECVVKTYCDQGQELMVQLGELRITSYHPIINMDAYEKDWCFPISIKEPKIIQCPEMYTFVVRNRQHLKVERFIYATLGHNCQEEIIRHDYFGSEKVITDLKRFNTYEEGYVHLTKDMMHRGIDNRIQAIYKRLSV